jgi:hypothetical protein
MNISDFSIRDAIAKSFDKKRQSGRWGVAQACNCQSILDAIATLIHAQRTDLAIIVIENELNSQT